MSRTLASLLLCAALLCAQQADLSQSFLVADADQAISHTPAVVYSADGTTFFAGLSNGEVVAFDVASNEIKHRYKATEGSVLSLALSSDGRHLVVSASDRGLFVRDVVSGEDVAQVDGIESYFLAMQPGDKAVAVAHGDRIEIRSLADLSLISQLGEGLSSASGVAWSPDGKRLAGIDLQGQLKVWRVEGAHELFALKHELALYAVCFAPDGARLAFGGLEKKVYQLDLESEQVAVVSAQQPYDITTLGYNPAGDVLAIGDESCDIWLLSLEQKEHLFHGKHHVECWLSQVAWSPDGESFTFGCRPNTLAAKPALYDANLQQEAFQSAAVQAEQQRVAALREAQLERLFSDELAEARQGLLTRLVELGPLAEDADVEAQRAALLNLLRGDDTVEQQQSMAGQQIMGGWFGGQQLQLNEQLQTFEAVPQDLNSQQLQNSVPSATPAAANPELGSLLEELRGIPGLAELAGKELEARQQRDKAYSEGCERLGNNWCINSWKMQRD